jgi:hypothetical protein
MATPEMTPSPVHLFEIPADINELTGAQIDAWAEQAYGQLMAQLKNETLKEKKSNF